MGAKLGGARARGGGRRRTRGMISEINVTPLVDVMLVLLIIFMVTAPLLTAGVAVDLPKAKAAAMRQQDSAPLEVSVDAKGNIFIGETRVGLERLQSALMAIAKERPDRRVYVRADKKLSYGDVMGVMAAVSGSGFTKIALVSDPASARDD